MFWFLLQLLSIVLRGRLVQVPPNKAAVITGMKGTRILRQGSTWVKVPLERFQGFIDLSQLLVELSIDDAYTKLFVPVTVKAVALIKVKGDDESIRLAAERYLGMPTDQIRDQVRETLLGHLRSILATMTVEEINSNRQILAERTSKEAEVDLSRMGIGIDAFTIQHVKDEFKNIQEVDMGYMDALGQKSIAEAKREAIIQASKARREAEVFRAEQDAQIAQASRDRDLRKWQYESEVAQGQAKAQQAGPRASAVARQEVVVEEVRIEERRKQAETAVQEKEIERKRKELEATVVQPAEAEKQAVIRRAEAQRESRVRQADAERIEREQEGTGEGKKIREVGEAEADIIRRKAEAGAAGERARLLAQAEGQEKLVQALNTYSEAGFRIAVARELVERLPAIVEAASKPMGQIDKVVMIDSGSGGNSGTMNRFMSTAPVQIARALEMLKETTGIDVAALLQKKTGEEEAAQAKPEEEGQRKKAA